MIAILAHYFLAGESSAARKSSQAWESQPKLSDSTRLLLRMHSVSVYTGEISPLVHLADGAGKNRPVPRVDRIPRDVLLRFTAVLPEA